MREPLIHFLIIGVLLFVVYSLMNNEPDDSENSNHIVISANDINRLAVLWERKWQRPPHQTEIDSLIKQQIREEIMYREALKLGLDQNDTAIRRRLAQKLEFISSDLAKLAEPTDVELQEFLSQHIKKFTLPTKISFEHIYFNEDKRQKNALKDAEKLLNTIADKDNQPKVNFLGDPFMLGHEFEMVSKQDMSNVFGNEFADNLFELHAGYWAGPIQSVYGVHIVRLESKIEAKEPELKDIYSKVKNEWLAEQEKTISEGFYKRLSENYKITIENSSTNVALPNTTQ